MRKALAVALSMLLVVGTGAAQLQDTGEPISYSIVDREGDGNTEGNLRTLWGDFGTNDLIKSSNEVCFGNNYRIDQVTFDASHNSNGVTYGLDLYLDSGSADSTFR